MDFRFVCTDLCMVSLFTAFQPSWPCNTWCFQQCKCHQLADDAAHVANVSVWPTMQKMSTAEMGVLTNLSGLLHVHPLAVILQQELMAAWGVLQGNAVDSSGPKHSHTSCCLKGNQRKVSIGNSMRLRRHSKYPGQSCRAMQKRCLEPKSPSPAAK